MLLLVCSLADFIFFYNFVIIEWSANRSKSINMRVNDYMKYKSPIIIIVDKGWKKIVNGMEEICADY